MEASVNSQLSPAKIRMRRRRLLPFILLPLAAVILVLFDAMTGQFGLFSLFPPATQTLQVSSPICGTWELKPEPFAGIRIETDLSEIAATPSGDIWAVGNSTKLIGEGYHPTMAHWEGNHWRIVGLPDVHAEKASLDSISFLNDEDGWAVGHYNLPGPGVIAMHWNGWNWSLSPMPPLLGALNRVHSFSPDDVWAVGWKNMAQPMQEFPLIMHWNGADWWEIKLPGTLASVRATLYDVLPLSKDNVWIVGGYTWAGYREALILHWDGNNWNTVPARTQCSGQHSLSSLSAASPNDVWAVGSCDDGDPTVRQKLAQHWDGTRWTLSEVANPEQTPGFLSGVTTLSSNDVWSVGTNEADGVTAFVRHWDGSRWQALPPPPAPWSPQVGQDIISVSLGEVWIRGYGYIGSHPLIASFVRCP